MNEIGGEFHWSGIPTGPMMSLPDNHRWFGTARAIVIALAKAHHCQRIFLPSYFCPHTAHYWTNHLAVIRYIDHPLREHPAWESLRPTAGDMVIAVNFFGVRNGAEWQQWQAQHPDTIVVEDHTHDMLSTWAVQSQAAYAFASLRKTLPVADGAIVWSPTGQTLPPEPIHQNWTGSALKLAGMLWKKAYIDTGEQDSTLKSIFQHFQVEGEEMLASNAEQQVAPWSQTLLAHGVPEVWRIQREKNVRQLFTQLPQNAFVRPLFQHWPVGHCPFNAILITDTPERRNALSQFLIQRSIFPPIHWQFQPDGDSEAWELSQRVLTVPVDHRYSHIEIEHIVATLQQFVDLQ